MITQKLILSILGLGIIFGLGFAVVKTKNQTIEQVGEEPIEVPGKPVEMPTKPTISKGSCYVGGCSGQICSDQKDIVSTCEYREEYACYRTAKCERQISGQCGWAQTPALQACLTNGNKGIY